MPPGVPSPQKDVKPALSADLAWLEEGGELGKLISHYPWESTPLGPLRQWPQSLRTAVSLMLNSQHPMWIGWGPEITFLYNDAYISVLSRSKHPWALGRPAQEVWAEIWDVCGPLTEKVFQRGQASFFEDVQLFMKRGDFIEETYYSFSYSPIRDESGRVGGLFCPSAEVSSKVLNTRRLSTLSELSANALLEKTVSRACETAFATLRKNFQDVPFAALYLFESTGKTLERVQQIGLKKSGEKILPTMVDFAAVEFSSLWPFVEVLGTGKLATVSLPVSDALPDGAANQRISSAVFLPVAARGNDRPFGFLAAGINPARSLDQEYRTFYELIAGQIATAIQNARASEEQRRQAEELAELDRAKTTFFSNVSHELRTPLTLMLGPLEELLSHGQANNADPTAALAQVAHRNGLRLLKLVNTLLDFSRLEAGRLQGRFEALDLGAYTAELASTFRSAIEHAGLKFVVDTPIGFEAAYIDPNLWEKIVLNLLSNALKFTLQGEIAIRLRETSEAFVLEVNDTGIGIPVEAQPRLFERFYRVEGSRGRTQEGTGIGLALVQDLVRLHGGNIRAESAVGVGTRFTVSIPRGSHHLPADRLIREHRQATSQISKQFTQEASRWNGVDDLVSVFSDLENRESITAGSAQKRGRVLVVDDNADMRDYIARLLAEKFDVLTASDGEGALEVLKHTRPDLILSDVMMPRLDGFGLIRAVRANPAWRTLPVILVSARAGDESRLEGVNEGADDYLVKPFSARELIARVSTHLELARARQESERKERQAREELEITVAERTAKLRETIGELEAFSYSISHDMRAPLRSMHGYAELLVSEFSSQLSEEAQGYLQRVIRNATRLEMLVHDVLAYSRVAKEEVQLRPVNLDHFVSPLLEQLQELQTGRAELRIKAPLPIVLGHEAYLSQIFTNLVGNAVKFARKDVPLIIEIGSTIENGMAMLTVTDNGIGIAPEHFGRIFEIFGRVYPDKMYEGTGIGLSIVKKAIHRLGGIVGVESKLGQGSTFWFTLRLA